MPSLLRRLTVLFLRGLLILSIGFAGLLAVGAAYQAIGTAQDARQFPPPGERYTADDLQLHLNCQGEGSPTVLLNAGLGDPGLTWESVMPALAEITRVCAFDRAGYGWSEAGPLPRTSARQSAELHALLESAGVPGPYVLVGHSMGGLFSLHYASQHPDDIAGMVLVDSTSIMTLEEIWEATQGPVTDLSPEQQAELATIFSEESLNSINADPTLRALHALAPFGAARLLGAPMAEEEGGAAELLSAEGRDAYIAQARKAPYFSTVISEGTQVQATVMDTRAGFETNGGLGNLPLIVLTAGEESVPQQDYLVGLSSAGTQVIVPDCGHYIQLEQPDVVIEAVQAVIAAARG
ncbi:MAG: alpha/beta hydrolase [Anaerolineae bacterium]|nr:alpha/beta hydrolase [Anaerolineae bacterium]